MRHLVCTPPDSWAPEIELHWPSKPNALGARLPCAGEPHVGLRTVIPVGNCGRRGKCPVLGLAGVLRRDYQVRVLGFMLERSQRRVRDKQKQVYLEGCMLQSQNSDWLRK